MQIDLTPEQDDVVRHAVATGRVSDPEAAVRDAMMLWVERERRRAELSASLDAAEASLARGEGVEITKNAMTALANEIVDRQRHRFAKVLS